MLRVFILPHDVLGETSKAAAKAAAKAASNASESERGSPAPAQGQMRTLHTVAREGKFTFYEVR
eukprot:scaffold1435_cov267-Pinguiococcus_pyrenoidosus.AAC.25